MYQTQDELCKDLVELGQAQKDDVGSKESYLRTVWNVCVKKQPLKDDDDPFGLHGDDPDPDLPKNMEDCKEGLRSSDIGKKMCDEVLGRSFLYVGDSKGILESRVFVREGMLQKVITRTVLTRSCVFFL